MAKKVNTTQKKRVTKKVVTEEPVIVEAPQSVQAGEEGIDIVVPMVFPNGYKWLETYKDACEKVGRKPKIGERYRSWDLERYFFRGIAKFMPFVRKVHLILFDEGQIPFWLNKDKVHVVLHKDIMPEDVLPTFNSSTIEMWLHNIEGLSETFIYCNDDMIATSPFEATDFFVDGKPVMRYAEKQQGIGDFMIMCRSDLELIAGDYGKSYDKGIVLRDGHTYTPLLLSAVKEVVRKHGKLLHDSCTTFREAKNYNQYIYSLEQWFAGKCVNGYHTHRYFSLSSDYDTMTKMLLSGTSGVACFNDAGIGEVSEMKGIIFKALQQILGDKCDYEL